MQPNTFKYTIIQSIVLKPKTELRLISNQPKKYISRHDKGMTFGLLVIRNIFRYKRRKKESTQPPLLPSIHENRKKTEGLLYKENQPPTPVKLTDTD